MIWFFLYVLIALWLIMRWRKLRNIQRVEDYVFRISDDVLDARLSYSLLSKKDRDMIFFEARACGYSPDEIATIKDILS